MRPDRYERSVSHFDRLVVDAAGVAALATGYADKTARLLRYHCARRLPGLDCDSWQGSSLLDVGSGPGHFKAYLEQKGGADGLRYQGIDTCEGMAALARAKAVDVRHGDVFSCHGLFDWVVANGVFMTAFSGCVKADLETLTTTLDRMVRLSRKGVAFDLLKQRPGEGGAIAIREAVAGVSEMFINPLFARLWAKSHGPRFAIDEAASSRFYTVYLFRRDDLYKRAKEADL